MFLTTPLKDLKRIYSGVPIDRFYRECTIRKISLYGKYKHILCSYNFYKERKHFYFSFMGPICKVKEKIDLCSVKSSIPKKVLLFTDYKGSNVYAVVSQQFQCM